MACLSSSLGSSQQCSCRPYSSGPQAKTWQACWSLAHMSRTSSDPQCLPFLSIALLYYAKVLKAQGNTPAFPHGVKVWVSWKLSLSKMHRCSGQAVCKGRGACWFIKLQSDGTSLQHTRISSREVKHLIPMYRHYELQCHGQSNACTSRASACCSRAARA